MGLQVEVSAWLEQVVVLLPVGYAFGAGMVSAVNPCGFAMLPVYLSLYLGANDTTFKGRSIGYRILKSCWIAAVVTAGFGVLFGLVGVAVSAGGSFLMEFMPWLAAIVGGGLVLLGFWLLLGRTFGAHFLQRIGTRIGDPRDISVSGFFLFGMAFGATSMGCTLPIFLMVVGSSATSGNFAAGILQFFSYIIGMGSVILLLTLGIALVREGVVVGAMRRTLPYIQKVSALFLIVAGGYIVYYWFSSGLLFHR
ncbi:cytochrome c biogenesis CcdA family protein [Desulforhopalus singaporensis]|uniref:Cytochrome c biogenesis protein CcdA n=1 Tax=Desulforhopalus singaporensis TaxID=91360 RepID=A0A1H0NF81_9BACT|nr:cytochrome c biogenesis protein CcdA [Desulforhopalus singaporensis]SDO91261.1 Cytochrome c biogenesis protein CcdA [Desulforhopalus singaporensis]